MSIQEVITTTGGRLSDSATQVGMKALEVSVETPGAALVRRGDFT